MTPTISHALTAAHQGFDELNALLWKREQLAGHLNAIDAQITKQRMLTGTALELVRAEEIRAQERSDAALKGAV